MISFYSYTSSTAYGSVVPVLEMEMNLAMVLHLTRAEIRMRSSKSKTRVLSHVPYLEIIHEPPCSLPPPDSLPFYLCMYVLH